MGDHSGHSHDTKNVSDARLVWAIAINLLLSVVEIVVGIFANSLSLLADAAHNFNDCATLAIALIARIISRRDADKRRTFGYRRAEVIGAFINLLLLTIVGLYLIYEAVARYFHPEEAQGWPMIVAATVALVVDLGTVGLLYGMAKGSINLRAGFLHNIADALASVGVIIGGVVILLWQWYIADLIITVVIAGYILWQSISLFRPTIATLMESVPSDIDLNELIAAMTAVEGVTDIHHVHVWELDEHHRALEAHVEIARKDHIDQEEIKLTLKG